MTENRAYNDVYLNDARKNIAHSFDYAVKKIGIPLDVYFNKFLSFKYIHLLEIGTPKYVTGMSGAELAIMICNKEDEDLGVLEYYEPGVEYWIGWIISYYQWLRNIPYSEIACKFPFERFYGSYATYHECDDLRMIDYIDRVIFGKELGNE